MHSKGLPLSVSDSVSNDMKSLKLQRNNQYYICKMTKILKQLFSVWEHKMEMQTFQHH